MTEHPTPSSLNNTKQGLSRQNAIYFDSSYRLEFVKDKYDITAILLQLDAKYPHLEFLRYEEALQKLNTKFLETANTFEADFYQSHLVGMSKEAAELFRQHVLKEYTKALLVHERGKARRRGEHYTVPVSFS
jgi:hypothetical protein